MVIPTPAKPLSFLDNFQIEVFFLFYFQLIVKVSRTGADGGLPFGPEEERMKSRLESLEASFNKPSGIKVSVGLAKNG